MLSTRTVARTRRRAFQLVALYVYLSGHPAPRSSAELDTDGAFEVRPLKGNIGSQNYDLPADLDPSRFRSVVIYCRRFTTVFSTAELLPG